MQSLAARVRSAVAGLFGARATSRRERGTHVPLAARPSGLVVYDEGADNLVDSSSALLTNVTIGFQGDRNRVVFAKGCHARDCTIELRGDDNLITIGSSHLASVSIGCRPGNRNRLEIGDECLVHGLSVEFMHEGNAVTIGSHTTVNGTTELAAFEGTSVSIGQDCLFGGDIRVWTSDSHSMVDADGRRVNPAANVTVGDHVWVCSRSTLLKGAAIPDHCVVGMQAVVTRAFEEPLCVIGGNPASVVRTGVDWRHELLPAEDERADSRSA